MTDNQEYIYGLIITEIKMGFFSLEELEESILEEIEDNGFENEISEEWALKNITEEFKKHQEASKSFSKNSDTERLIKAFDELGKNNIIALHNAGYSSAEGDSEVVEIEIELEKDNIVSDGYCLYHQQDIEGIIEEKGSLHLRFNKVDNTDEEVSVTIGKKIVEILKKYNFDIEWNETAHQRIAIKDFEWQWAYNEDNRDLIDYYDVIQMIKNNDS